MEAIIVLEASNGLHARPAAELAAMAKRFKSNIILIAGTKEVNARNILSLLTLGLKQGSVINLRVEGDDCEAAFEEVTRFFEHIGQ